MVVTIHTRAGFESFLAFVLWFLGRRHRRAQKVEITPVRLPGGWRPASLKGASIPGRELRSYLDER
jgi:hypothetical protein